MRKHFCLRAASTVLILSILMCSGLLGQARVKRIAVFDFDSTGLRDQYESNWNVGKDFTSRINYELIKNGTFEVVERNELTRIRGEQDQSWSEGFDKKSALQLGRLASASAVVLGVINQFGIQQEGKGFGPLKKKKTSANVELTARIVDVVTGKLIATAKGVGVAEKKGQKLQAQGGDLYSSSASNFEESLLGAAMASAVDQLVMGLVESADAVQETVIEIKGVVAEVDGQTIGMDVGMHEGLMRGDVVHVVNIDKKVVSPRTQRFLYERTSTIATVEINEVGPDYAIGELQMDSAREIKVGDHVRLPGPDK